MMGDYSCFGDVVCFDTTYKTNKEGRPFGLFVGVNHHRQTIIFGAALLYDETIPTFCWLFKTFVRAMSGKEPKTILTDHDKAMFSAIASVLPNTYHRFCVWHMFQNAAKHLSDVFNREKSFAKDFSRCVYEYENEDEFVEAWNTMIDKYNLLSNEWLKARFAERDRWSLAYGRNTFCADMSTTQRSESMNAAVKKYLNTQKEFLRFLGHFDRLLEDRRYDELKSDCKMMNSVPVIEGRNVVLENVKAIYTEEVFHIVKQEVNDVFNCRFHEYNQAGTVTEYKVINESAPRPREHIVTFDHSMTTIACSCKKFEYAGILCCHALYVLRFNGIKNIPQPYILKRWTRDAKNGGFIENKHGSIVESDPKLLSAKRYKDLCHAYIETVRKAAEYSDSYDFAIDMGKKLKDGVDNIVNELSQLKLFNEDLRTDIASDGTERINKQYMKIDAKSTHFDGTYDTISSCEELATTDVYSRAKGIKKRVRGGRAGTSVRRITGALNKAIKRRRTKKKESANELNNDVNTLQSSNGIEVFRMPGGTSTSISLCQTTPPTPHGVKAIRMPMHSLTPTNTSTQQSMGSGQASQVNLNNGNYGFSPSTCDYAHDRQKNLSQGNQSDSSPSNYGFTQMLQPFLFPYGAQPNAK